MAGIAEAAEEMPDIHGRACGIHPQTPSATVLHAAAQLAAELAAAALVIPTETGGAPRADAKYRTKRPVIALSHNPVLRNQLMLEWGVYPMTMPTTASVELVEASVAARDFGGIPSGARVVLTSGRQTDMSGATSLTIVCDIPRADDSGLPHRRGTAMTTASRAAVVDTVVPCVECPPGTSE